MDASFSTVFKTFTDAAKAASAKVTSDESAQQKIRIDAAKQGTKAKLEEEKSANSHIRQLELMRIKQGIDDERKGAKERRRAIVEEASKGAHDEARIQKTKVGDAARTGRMIAQAQMRAERDFARGGGGVGGAGRRGGGPGGRDMSYRMGYWASRNFSPVTPMLSYGARAASQLMRGAGVNLDVGSMVGESVKNQKTVTDITNSGYVEGAKGKQGQMQDSVEVMKDVKSAANAVALSYGDALEGLQKYVAKTGDLESGRLILADMGKLARATGTSFADMVDAAGDVGNALGNVDNKASKVRSVMMAIAGQGKVGAVEIKDLAKQMAKVGAASGIFRGGAEGNMVTLGAMVQKTRESGGAASATQAATSAMSFLNLFSKEARVKQYEKFTGRKAFDKDNKLTGPEELVLEMLRGTQGDNLKMGKIVADSGARRFTRGFEKTYREGGGGKMVDFDPKTMPSMAKGFAQLGANGTYQVQAGLVAVAKEFDRLRQATLTETNLADAFAKSMNTAEAKTQKFNNRMQDIADKLVDRVLPQMEKLGESALAIVGAFGDVAVWLAENPFAAIPAALGLAIAKAGIEQSIRAGIENVFKAMSGNAGPGAGGGFGVMGNLSAAFAIASMTATTFYAGKLFIDSIVEKKKKDQEEAIAASITAGSDAGTLAQQIKAGKVKKESVDKAYKDADDLEKKATTASTGTVKIGIGEQILRGISIMAGGREDIEKAERMTRETAKRQLEESIALRRLANEGLKVHVTNLVDGAMAPPPKAPPGSRTNAGAPTEAE